MSSVKVAGAMAFGLVLAMTAGWAHAQPAPKPGDAHLEKGIQLFEANDLEGAQAELEQAYAADPGPDACYALGQVLRKKKRCDQAIGYFRQAVEQSPSEAFTRAAQYQIGRCVVENPTLATPTPGAPRETQAPETRAALQKWWQDPAGGALLGVGLGAVIAGTAALARAQVEAADAKDGLQAFRDASNVTALRIGGGVTLGLGGVLVLGGIIRYAVHAKAIRSAHERP